MQERNKTQEDTKITCFKYEENKRRTETKERLLPTEWPERVSKRR